MRVAPGRALTNAEAILTAAVAWRPTLMVGQLPICDIAVDRRIRHLSDDFASLCAGLRVPYLDVFDLVAASDIWAREIAAGDAVHPNEGGYAVIGDVVENWAGWRAWIELSTPPRRSTGQAAMAGMGHFYPYAMSSAIGWIAPMD